MPIIKKLKNTANVITRSRANVVGLRRGSVVFNRLGDYTQEFELPALLAGDYTQEFTLPARLTGDYTQEFTLPARLTGDYVQDFTMRAHNVLEWTERQIGVVSEDWRWNQLVYGNGRFVMLGVAYSINTINNYYGVATSIDGINWTVRTLPLIQYDNHQAVLRCCNGSFFVINRTEVAASSDGISFISSGILSTPDLIGRFFCDIAYGNGVYVIIGGLSESANRTYGGFTCTSTSGSMVSGSWQKHDIVAPSDLGWHNILYGNGIFAASHRALNSIPGKVRTSVDGIHWPNEEDLFTIPEAFVLDVFISGGVVSNYISTDALTWSTGGSYYARWRRMAFGHDLYVEGGLDSQMRTETLAVSSNSLAWTEMPFFVLNSANDQLKGIHSIQHGNGMFVGLRRDMRGVYTAPYPI